MLKTKLLQTAVIMVSVLPPASPLPDTVAVKDVHATALKMLADYAITAIWGT